MTFRSATRPGARRRLAPALLVALMAPTLVVGAAACSTDDDASSVLDQVAPTKADVAAEAGIEFPSSTKDFRLVRVSGDQIDVTFTIAATDVDAFATGSAIDLQRGERTIKHASPLWDLAVPDDVRGGSSTEDGVGRSAEVVTDGDTATVRLTINRS